MIEPRDIPNSLNHSTNDSQLPMLMRGSLFMEEILLHQFSTMKQIGLFLVRSLVSIISYTSMKEVLIHYKG